MYSNIARLSILLFLVSSIHSFAQTNLTFKGQLNFTKELSDIWGYTSPGGTEYALVGLNNGLSIVDISDPTNPRQTQFVTGVKSDWRDIKTWGNYAYVTNETGDGLTIVNLTNLPGAVTSSNWTGGSLNLSTAHNIYIDENGFAYITGANVGQGGVLILDLNSDPENPVHVGTYDQTYLHDCYVRNDVLYGAHINDGYISVMDVSDKANPVVLGIANTPHNLAHNIWPSDDAMTVFTTDETNNAYVAAFDVSDPTDIEELDRYQSNPGSNSIPHNTHVLNDYLITSYYRDGVTIVDAARPHNLIEVGQYDTSPQSGNGYNGSWGAYPYFNSGLIVASDIELGVFVLEPNYVRACYLEGTVTDATNSSAIQNAQIELVGTGIDAAQTDISGNYASGTAASGTYSIEVSASGYITQTLSNTALANGILTTLNVELLPSGFVCQIPDNLNASDITSVSARLNWNSAGGADTYDVRYKEPADTVWIVNNTPASSTTIVGLTECTLYEFQVQSICSGVESGFSSSAYFSTIGNNCPTPCDIPQNAAATNISGTSVTFDWDAIGNALSYNVQYKLTSASVWTDTTSPFDSIIVSGLTTCSSYELKVQAVCQDLNSLFTPTVQFTSGDCPANYCTSEGENVFDEWIETVNIGSINNTSGADQGYGDYTAMSTDLTSNTEVQITLTPGFSGRLYDEYWRVWVDYNRDGDFDDRYELAFDAPKRSKLPVSGTFFVPKNTVTGPTRMRVSMKYKKVSHACETFEYGEVEDYTVNLIAGDTLDPDTPTVCAPPYQLEATNILAPSFIANWEFTSSSLNQNFKIWFKEQLSEKWKKKGAKKNTTSKLVKKIKPSLNYEWKMQNKCKGTGWTDFTQTEVFSSPSAPKFETVEDFNLPERQGELMLSLFPNPASEVIDIEVGTFEAGNFSFLLTDINGKIILQGEWRLEEGSTLKRMNIDRLSNGYYLLSLVSTNAKGSAKFLVIR